MQQAPTLEDQVEVLEIILQLVLTAVEHSNPGSIQSLKLALENNRSLGNVVSMTGEKLETSPAVVAYALHLLRECE